MKIIDIDVFAPDEIAMRRFPVRLSYIDADDLHQEAWDAAAEIVERTHRAYGMREVTSMCAYIEALVAEKAKGPEARPRANNN